MITHVISLRTSGMAYQYRSEGQPIGQAHLWPYCSEAMKNGMGVSINVDRGELSTKNEHKAYLQLHHSTTLWKPMAWRSPRHAERLLLMKRTLGHLLHLILLRRLLVVCDVDALWFTGTARFFWRFSSGNSGRYNWVHSAGMVKDDVNILSRA